METKKSGFRSATVLQQFSHKINQDGPKTVVSTALHTVVKQGETPEQAAEQNIQAWKSWLSGIDPAKDLVHKPLEDLRQEVIKEWKDIATLDIPGVSMMKDVNGIPSMADLLRAADVASVSWKEQQAGKFQQLRRRFCEFAVTMQKCSGLFEIVPSGDKYICLIAGVISSVIKISATYEKAAEAFSSGLESIKEELQYTFEKLEIVKTASMENHIVGLYLRVFEFLKTALKWFSKRRIRVLKSAVSDYNKEIECLVANVKDEVRKVARYAEVDTDAKIYETYAEVKLVGQRLTSIEGILQALLNRPEIAPELEAVFDKWYAVGHKMEDTLGASEQQAKHDEKMEN